MAILIPLFRCERCPNVPAAPVVCNPRVNAIAGSDFDVFPMPGLEAPDFYRRADDVVGEQRPPDIVDAAAVVPNQDREEEPHSVKARERAVKRELRIARAAQCAGYRP